VPNEIVLTLGVETNNKDLPTAKNENDQRLKKIIEVAKKMGVEDKYIQTDYINIDPRYKHEWENRQFIGYFVRNSLSVTLRDVSKFDSLLSGVLEEGAATNVHGVDFRTTELRKHRDQARSLAIKAAQEKANDLAKQLGQTIGKPFAIQEGRSHEWANFYNFWGSRRYSQMTQNVMQDEAQSMDTTGSSVALGQLTIKAQITVSFELQ
jgi:uncharacterized protein YggE